MSDYCVVVVNGACARLLSLEGVEFPELESGPNLIEHDKVVNTEISDGRDLWADKHSGQNRGPRNGAKGGAAHRYDDHRDQHKDESERRFARDVASRAADLARSTRARQVVLVAQKRMLGFLRDALDPLLKAGVELREVPKDLARLDPQSIQAKLARENLLPRRTAPGA